MFCCYRCNHYCISEIVQSPPPACCCTGIRKSEYEAQNRISGAGGKAVRPAHIVLHVFCVHCILWCCFRAHDAAKKRRLYLLVLPRGTASPGRLSPSIAAIACSRPSQSRKPRHHHLHFPFHNYYPQHAADVSSHRLNNAIDPNPQPFNAGPLHYCALVCTNFVVPCPR